MGTCKYCGQDAGWFSRSHKECEEKHAQGLNDFSAVVSAYFTTRTSAANVQSSKNRLKIDAYLSDDDVCEIADAEIRRYTASIHRPFSPASIRLMDDFLNVVGVSFGKINSKGAAIEE
jgi:hypothetical protein